MRVRATLLAGICASAIAFPAQAQDTDEDFADFDDPRLSSNVIIVTAQRQNQSLQEVPIAVSAFDSEALEDGCAVYDRDALHRRAESRKRGS